MASLPSSPANIDIKDSEKEDNNTGHETEGYGVEVAEMEFNGETIFIEIPGTGNEGEPPILYSDSEEVGYDEPRGGWVKSEVNASDLLWTREKRLAEVEILSKSKGGLEALRAMFLKLERKGVGTTRSEEIAKDITYQNIMRSIDKEAKLRP